jgi:hypothetical protein
MAKGIWGFAGWSRGAGEVWVRFSGNNGLFGVVADVGDGRTSASRDGGSFLSLFQMVVPHGKAEGPVELRPRTADEAE